MNYAERDVMNDFKKILDRDFLSEAPEASAGPLGLPVVRAPSKGKLSFVLLSDAVRGTWTHYFRRRTQPCMGDQCQICPLENTRRWYGWLVGFNAPRREKVLLEVPAGVALNLKAWRAERGSLRGCSLTLFRANSKENGPVRGSISPCTIDVGLLPECPAIESLLCRMWQIKDVDAVNESGQIGLHFIDGNNYDQDEQLA
jgi:hypothetical protein